jgi:hypothetical protein
LTDEDLAALNVYQEADGEPDDGKAAVMRIVQNRIKKRYFSDGTILGTVLSKDQFSWAWFGFETVHSGTATHVISTKEYVRLSWTLTEAQQHAETLLELAAPSDLTHCSQIARAVVAGTYTGPLYANLTDDAVLYLNPRILTKLPTWAIPIRKICSIGHHDFYRADDPPPGLVA